MRARLGACGLVLSACVVFWARTGDQTRHVHRHLLVYGIAFAAYLLALRWSRGLAPRGLRLALGIAVAWRALLVPAPPLVSDDVNRYVWEGRIQNHGGNPYAWADRPESERWDALHDDVWHGVNHKDYTAIYPPLWQLVARAVVAVSDSVLAMKAILALCEMLAIGVLLQLLRRRGLPPERVLVLAWSPLALVEIAGSGHNEALGLLLVAMALLGLESGQPALSALAAAAGVGIKILPGLVAAAWARRYRPVHVLLAVLALVLPFLPFLEARQGLWRSLGKFAAYWQFNETLFAPLAALLGREAAHGVALAILFGLATVLAWRGVEPAAAGLAVVASWLALSANILPWYALWLLPLLVLRDAGGLLLFTGSVGLAYLVYPEWLAGGPWHVGWGVRALEYGPCVLLGVIEVWRRRRC